MKALYSSVLYCKGLSKECIYKAGSTEELIQMMESTNVSLINLNWFSQLKIKWVELILDMINKKETMLLTDKELI